MPDIPTFDLRGPGGSGRCSSFGGHVLGWRPDRHRPVLYLSPRARLDGSKAIRGGIPVCFPWFGAGPSGDRDPAHGTVRAKAWELQSQAEGGANFETDTPDGFRIALGARFGAELTLRVRVERTGPAPAPFELALHTYLAVSDAAEASVTGLAGASRLDQLTGERATQGPEPVRFDGEYDRVFTGCPGPQTLHDPGWGRRVVVTPTDLPSAVVWNPGPAKAASMADLGEDQFPRFVCIESGRVREDAPTLAPGEAFEAAVRFDVEPLEA